MSGSPERLGALVLAVLTTALLWPVYRLLYPTHPKVIPSPRQTTLPTLSDHDFENLYYSPVSLPGGRNIETPYGSIQVYEWGPEAGKKVLFVHGVNTSCLTLGPMARKLVSKGYRVMLFDLFGRGFTDGVGDLPYDMRLYVTQLLLVLASSSLAWSGRNAFRLIGYSFGGSIAVGLATTFPDLVESLVLLAPTGLIRTSNIGAVNRVLYSFSSSIPEGLLSFALRKILQKPLSKGALKNRHALAGSADPSGGLVDTAVSEAVGQTTSPGSTVKVVEHRIQKSVLWQLKNHLGFIPAFISTVRYGPVLEQEELWRLLSRRTAKTTVVIFGRDDRIIVADEYTADGLHLVGGLEKVVWATVNGAHGFPTTHVDETLEIILPAWEKDQLFRDE